MRTRIKFCGINTRADLDYAVSLGADAVGLVFHPTSPRSIDIDKAQALLQEGNGMIKIVGLFMDADHQSIEQVVSLLDMDYLQFHGIESPQFCMSFSLPYIKAIPMADRNTADEMIEAHCNTADILLLDGHRVGMPGGSGTTFEWSDFSKINTSVFIAGGLTPENVEPAIMQCRPQGVDVSSGVESTVGIKDHVKMRAFVQAVLRTDYNRA